MDGDAGVGYGSADGPPVARQHGVQRPLFSADTFFAALALDNAGIEHQNVMLGQGGEHRMIVDYTGRQFEITPKIRKEVEAGLAKLVKIVGDNCSSKVILTAEKQRRIAEITLTRRTKTLVGHGESTDVLVAIDEALEHIEKQALKLNTRKRDVKRAVKPAWKQRGARARAGDCRGHRGGHRGSGGGA